MLDFSGKMLALSDEEFRLISDLVYDLSGIHLTEQKKLLVQGRLSKLVKERNCSSFKEYYELVMKDPEGVELSRLIDRISTNHTYFYRESRHYDFLFSKLIPEWKENHLKGESFKVWSAGCSSGEEPYTISLLMKENEAEIFRSAGFGILATDISLTMLRVALNGIYSSEKLEHLPTYLKKKYFRSIGEEWQIREEVKEKILFKRLNLMRDTYPFKGLFDLIFCRNVMIYFDAPTRESLIKKFVRYLKPGGYLFIGHSESLGRETQGLKYIMPATYRKLLES